MNQIGLKQNEKKLLELLFVQRALYSKAKKMFAWRVCIALVLAIVAPIITSILPQLNVYVGVAAIVYLIIDNWVLKSKEEADKETAAKVQELFDTEVLSIPWNSVVVGEKPDPEIIAETLGSNTGKDFSGLRDWYAVDVARAPLLFAQFLCQRTNAWWDTDLRSKYCNYVSSAMGLLVLIVTLLAVSRNTSAIEIILGLVIPVIPLFEVLIEQIKDHKGSASKSQELKLKIDAAIEKQLVGETIDEPDRLVRAFQDQIFRHRCECPMIFDWIYEKLKASHEQQMQYSIKTRVDDYLAQNVSR